MVQTSQLFAVPAKGKYTHIDVPAESESNPSASFADTSFGYSVDILLFLEDFRVLCHILGRAEGIKVTDIKLGIKHRDEGRGGLTQFVELKALVEWHRLNVLNVGDPVPRMGDQSRSWVC
jgi:hypothetical protein